MLGTPSFIESLHPPFGLFPHSNSDKIFFNDPNSQPSGISLFNSSFHTIFPPDDL